MADRGSKPLRADYGIDAPGDVRAFALGGLACLIAGFVGRYVLPEAAPEAVRHWMQVALWPGLGFSATSILMVYASRVRKLALRDSVIAAIPWRGHEQVLDVGCGRGLMLLGAAKRLTSGRATGLDLWSQRDQGDNSAEATLRNADAEKVRDRIELVTADAREMPFAAGSFDVILSSWVIHNISGKAERERILQEIARVLKPGGRLVILDISYGFQYAAQLRRAGLIDVRCRLKSLLFILPTFEITACKPEQLPA